MNNRIIAITAAAIVGIGGVALIAQSASADDSWQGQLRTALEADWDNNTSAAEQAEGCAAVQMFGLTDPQAFADFAVSMGMTPADLTEGTDVDPASIEDVHEAAVIAGEVIVDKCEL